MKKFFVGVLMLVAFACYAGDRFEYHTVSASATNTETTFTHQFESLIMHNAGNSDVWCNIGTADASSTNGILIRAKTYLTIDVHGVYVNLKCDTGETTTVYITGKY